MGKTDESPLKKRGKIRVKRKKDKSRHLERTMNNSYLNICDILSTLSSSPYSSKHCNKNYISQKLSFYLFKVKLKKCNTCCSLIWLFLFSNMILIMILLYHYNIPLIIPTFYMRIQCKKKIFYFSNEEKLRTTKAIT